jgi:hypothetical protein
MFILHGIGEADMSKIHDGGPAFPVETYGDGKGVQTSPSAGWETGLSIRDWFAGQCAASALVNARGISGADVDGTFPLVAKLSYKMADAMLAARKAEAQS